jgi:general secretion pathway protein H
MICNKEHRAEKKNKGFTLIELLVVIVIIGITVGFALITFGDFGESRRIVFAAEELENTLRLAQQQAILESSTLGMRIDNSSYQILKFQNDSKWHTPSNKNLFKIHYFPKSVVITLQSRFKTKKDLPSIIINSSGETNAFTLNVGTAKEHTVAVLRGKDNGELTFSTVTIK